MKDTPRDAGALLKQERESRGMALDVVHEATKIPLDALKAIEEGYKVRSLTGFYYKSFVKIYAKYLGLDVAAVMALVPVHHPQAVAEVSVLRKPRVSAAGPYRVDGVRLHRAVLHAPEIFRKKKKFFVGLFVVVLAAGGLFLAGLLIRKIVTAVAVQHALNAASRPKAQPKKTPMASRPSVPQARPVEAKAAVPAEGDQPQEKPVPPVSRAAVTVRAQTTTWVTVKADNDTVFQGRIKKGTTESWSAAKKIEISAKDLGALEFEVNGRNIGKIARRDLKAKKVIVTPEGLSVEK